MLSQKASINGRVAFSITASTVGTTKYRVVARATTTNTETVLGELTIKTSPAAITMHNSSVAGKTATYGAKLNIPVTLNTDTKVELWKKSSSGSWSRLSSTATSAKKANIAVPTNKIGKADYQLRAVATKTHKASSISAIFPIEIAKATMRASVSNKKVTKNKKVSIKVRASEATTLTLQYKTKSGAWKTVSSTKALANRNVTFKSHKISAKTSFRIRSAESAHFKQGTLASFQVTLKGKQTYKVSSKTVKRNQRATVKVKVKEATTLKLQYKNSKGKWVTASTKKASAKKTVSFKSPRVKSTTSFRITSSETANYRADTLSSFKIRVR